MHSVADETHVPCTYVCMYSYVSIYKYVLLIVVLGIKAQECGMSAICYSSSSIRLYTNWHLTVDVCALNLLLCLFLPPGFCIILNYVHKYLNNLGKARAREKWKCWKIHEIESKGNVWNTAKGTMTVDCQKSDISHINKINRISDERGRTKDSNKNSCTTTHQ